jgi:hypothetical protein
LVVTIVLQEYLASFPNEESGNSMKTEIQKRKRMRVERKELCLWRK